MANYSTFSALIDGVQHSVHLATIGNILELGGSGLQMDGSISGNIVISASATTTSYSIVWPPAQAASAGYVLTNDGSGNLSWAAGGGSAVSSLNSLTGALTIVAGSGITVTPSGSNITITATSTGQQVDLFTLKWNRYLQ